MYAISDLCFRILLTADEDHVPCPDNRWRIHHPINGRPQQDDPGGWNESNNSPTSDLENGIPRSLDRVEDRSLHHPSLPHVFCVELG